MLGMIALAEIRMVAGNMTYTKASMQLIKFQKKN